MRNPVRRGAVAIVVCAVLFSCTEGRSPLGPGAGTPRFDPTAQLASVRISEIHYDNVGTDVGEAVEISAPEGTDLTGWTLVLYNGSGGASYNTASLSSLVPSLCSPRQVVVVNYPSNGIQNGSPDGLALVDNAGTVVEFLSYEGTFAATNGPALGLTSTDIGVSELGTEPVGQSLQRDGSGTWSAPTVATFGVCNDNNAPPPPPPPPPPPTLPATRIAEIHYDNAGADVGEAIEVEGPAGTDLTGWSLVLYNGTGGASYDTDALSGILSGTCNGRGVVVLNYPANGIQNGSPDGVALVDNTGAVVQFLSYEGTFTATTGPATGMLSVDIGVSEAGTEPAGQSLQLSQLGVWQAPATASFGTCNGFTPPPPPPPSSATLVINELMADPLHAAGGASFGEWFEVYNYGTAAVDLQGFTLVSGGQPNHLIGSSVVVPPGGFAVLGRGAGVALNGGLTIDYNYFTGTSTTIFLDATDFLLIRDAGGALVDSVRWTSSGTIAKGITRALREPATDNANVDGTAWGYSTTPFGDGDLGTPHAANGTLSDTPPPLPNFLTFTGRLASDPPLPVGFEDQLFATLRDGTGAAVPSTFTWEALTPAIATIDAFGVMHALAAGTATFRATAADGTVGTFSQATEVATLGGTAIYGNNTEFGDPADADASDDFIVRRLEYTTSYNPNRGSPNWVSYDLEATHIGGAVDRCDCFTHDPALPGSFTHLTTADYTGAGAAAGFGIDRGHMTRSFDRTAGALDNATTYYLSNVIPQASDLNQGPWAIMENFLGDQARNANMEVYIITGPAGNQGTVKGEGKIVIPTGVWKVAVIMPHDHGLADIHDYRDLQVIAVIMPNQAGVRNVDWHTYITTVDAVEALSGYDLLALLPDKVENAVEANIQPPLGAVDGPYTSDEGSAVNLSGAASVDPNGSIVSYAWDFGDGSTGSGATTSHTWAQDGNYVVSLAVTDNDGLIEVITTSASVGSVAPAITPLSPATILLGGQYTAAGSFTDPGADPWSATVTWGDGTPTAALPLSGQTFSAAHTYCAPGSFMVSVRVSDDDGTTGQSTTVTVLTGAQSIRQVLIGIIQNLVDTGRLSPGLGTALIARLQAAANHFDGGRTLPARLQIKALILELNVLLWTRRLSPEDAAMIRDALDRLVSCLR